MKRLIRSATQEDNTIVVNSAKEWNDIAEENFRRVESDKSLPVVFTDNAIDDIIDCIAYPEVEYVFVNRSFEISGGAVGRMHDFLWFAKLYLSPKRFREVKAQLAEKCPFYVYELDTKYSAEATQTFTRINGRLLRMLSEEAPAASVTNKFGKSYLTLHYKGKDQSTIEAILDQLENDPEVFEVSDRKTSSYYCFDVLCKW